MFFNAHFVSEKTLVFQSYFNIQLLAATAEAVKVGAGAITKLKSLE